MNLQEAKDFIAECTKMNVDDAMAFLEDDNALAKITRAGEIIAEADRLEAEAKRTEARTQKARQEREMWDAFYTPKPRPEAPDGMIVVTCSKCHGSGKYCSGVLNGRPTSGTGFTCWSCNGTGYKTRRRRSLNL
jgi:hypothetical protein